MRNITLNYTVSDNCVSNPPITVSVTSNEPVNGTGDGDTAPDWEIVNNNLVRLRAERAGNGNGRIYTITVTVNDGCNPSVSGSTQVRVAHNGGSQTTANTIGENSLESVSLNGLEVKVHPNPASSNFTLDIRSNNSNKPVSIQVFDQNGRIIETRRNINSGSTISLGELYKPGTYFVRIIQGKTYKEVKLMKLSD